MAPVLGCTGGLNHSFARTERKEATYNILARSVLYLPGSEPHIRLNCMIKLPYSALPPPNDFGGLIFGANDWSLGSGIGAGAGLGTAVVVLANLWLIPLIIPIAKYVRWF